MTGILMGVAIGDALGAPFETNDGSKSPLLENWDGVTFLPTPRLKLVEGEWTDDTLMSLTLAEQLIADGKYVREHVQAAYRQALKQHPDQGWGGVLRAALAPSSKDGVLFHPHRTGWTIGNGALMRCAPLAMLPHPDPERLFELVEMDASITHRHPHVYSACFLYVAMLRYVRWHSTVKDGWLHACEDLEDFDHTDDGAYVRDLVRDELEHPGRRVIPAKGSTLSTLLSVVRLSQTPVGALEAACQMGGDTDTRAALVGAMWAVTGRDYSEFEELVMDKARIQTADRGLAGLESQ